MVLKKFKMLKYFQINEKQLAKFVYFSWLPKVKNVENFSIIF